ncbi:MAG: zinc-dependent peptidase, partial [bacterium]|nr:zinc-dependent peptidase [bacterium]
FIRALIVLSAVAAYFPMFLTKTSFRRLKAVSKTSPPQWENFLERHSLYYPIMTLVEKKRFIKDIKILMDRLSIETPAGEEAGWENRMLAAIGFATVLIGRPSWELPLPRRILLVSGERFDENLQVGNGNYAAAATPETLYLTEDSLHYSFDRTRDGYNNIFHEIAHYFDMEDGWMDGRPYIFRFSSKQRENLFYFEWREIFNREFERVKQGKLNLRSHASRNIGELFACACELFFERPAELKQLSPDIYRLFLEFYNFDPLHLLYRQRQN